MSLEPPKGIEEVISDVPRGRIKLKDFSNIFFPMFLAYFKQEENIELGRWITYTKTRGYEWVDVIENGEVVFSVPPVLQSLTLEPGKQFLHDPADIMKIAAIKDRTIPGAGNAHIRENITSVLDLKDDYIEGQDKFRADWLPIFNYYGYDLDNGSAGKPKSGVSNNDYNPEDFQDYDEL